MAYKIIKDGSGESNPLENKMMTTDEVKLLIRQILSESTDFEMEPVEVVSFNTDGSIQGRYLISEHDKDIVDLNTFIPLNQNVIQYPVAGEVVIGVEFLGQRYYFSDISPLTRRINSQQFNISNTSNSNKETLSLFIDENNSREDVREGDTIIQGRFNNSIRLSSNQPKINSANITIQNDGGRILMAQNEKVKYSNPTLKFTELIDLDYNRPQINFDSDRIILNAKSDNIGIFAEGNVLIKGSKVDIENTNGGVNIKADTITNDISKNGGQIINKTKENAIPFPNLNMTGLLKQNFGVLKVFEGLTAGVPLLPSPIGIKKIVEGLKGAKDFIEATTNLEFLEKDVLTTKTPSEIAAALPIPGGFKSIVGDIETFSKDIEGSIDKLEKFVEDNEKVVEQAQQINDAINAGDRKSLLNVLENIGEEGLSKIPGANDALSIAQDKSVSGKDIESAQENGVFAAIENYLAEAGTGKDDLKTMKSFGKILKLTKQE
jgi:hypothetical protein